MPQNYTRDDKTDTDQNNDSKISTGDDPTKRMTAKFCSVSVLDRGNFYISINLA